MSPATDTTLVSSIILPTYKRPLEAPWPPAVGPIETLHLCAVRLSCLEKVGSAMVTLRASQGQTEARKPITATNEGLPFQTCLYLRSDCSAVVTLSATAAEDVILGLFIRGVGEKTGRCAWRGNVTFSVGATVWWDCDRAGERNMQHIPSARRARASDLFRINVL